eukprot:GHRR01030944.1.p1 GENE.GHRR01030944.1~~GHRR01030944.1.p1  ORF type:complete len:110 (-),score=18.79 GHRR01030944.1:3-332(-)
MHQHLLNSIAGSWVVNLGICHNFHSLVQVSTCRTRHAVTWWQRSNGYNRKCCVYKTMDVFASTWGRHCDYGASNKAMSCWRGLLGRAVLYTGKESPAQKSLFRGISNLV